MELSVNALASVTAKSRLTPDSHFGTRRQISTVTICFKIFKIERVALSVLVKSANDGAKLARAVSLVLAGINMEGL